MKLFVESARAVEVSAEFQPENYQCDEKNALSAENGAKMRLAARPKVRLQFSKFSGNLVNLSVESMQLSSSDMF